MGHTDVGIAAARRAAALNPLNLNSHSFLSGVLLYARRYDEALAAYQDGLLLRPQDPTWPANLGWSIYYALGDFEKMRALCEGVGEAVKDTPKALEWLETALQLRHPELIYLKSEPLLDRLRKEPRFRAIERALKFPGLNTIELTREARNIVRRSSGRKSSSMP